MQESTAGKPDPGTIGAILRESFPVECRRVGSENLDDIAHGHREFDDEDDGFRLDVGVGESLALLANVATVIAFVWQLLSRPGRETEPPRPEQIDEIVVSAVAESNGIPDEARLKVYVTIVRKLRDGPP